MINNLSDFTKLEQVCSTEEKKLSRNGHYGKFYHNPSSLVKCPRCGDCGELVDDGPVRSLYECQNCGIFSKIKPKKRLHGLRQSIAQGELTKALEILEGAGHLDQDDQKGGHGNA